jgi:alpha-tubulin suppressor-like RCC1 family protein
MRRATCVFLTVVLLLMGMFGVDGMGPLTARAEAPHIVQIAAGLGFSLALFSDGTLYAWGDNSFGQLGDGSNTNRSTPTLIGTGYTAIAAGEYHSLALKGSALYTWGYNNYGQLGDGTTTSRNTPALIDTGYTAIATGMYHILALKGSTLYAWGFNRDGQVGNGTYTDQYTPALVGTGYTKIAAGAGNSLALKGSALYAWGYNSNGQLGDGTTTHRNTPALIGTGYSTVAGGFFHTFALKDSTLYAWGRNDYGQLGDGTTTDRTAPVLIGTGYTAIAGGGLYSLALKGRALYAWGFNLGGLLGDGTTTNRTAPILIGTGYTAIAASEDHSLALKGGVLYAWGSNNSGQLGDGTTTSRNAPTRVTFPAAPTPEPLYISRFSAKSTSLSVGDKAVFTVETGKRVNLVRLYKDGVQVATSKAYKNLSGKRIWTFSPVMNVSGDFRYWAVASNASGDGVASADVIVNVDTSSLEVKNFTINSLALDVGETVTFTVATGKLASKVSILDKSDVVFASSAKPSKTTSKQKIWTIQRRLTEADMGSFELHAVMDSAYGAGPDSTALTLTVADNLPRVIKVTADKAVVKKGAELTFEVVTNAAATNIWISNDKKEKWQQTVVESTGPNRQTWRVTTFPKQLGIRKFYAQAYQGTLPGPKVYVKKIRVTK